MSTVQRRAAVAISIECHPRHGGSKRPCPRVGWPGDGTVIEMTPAVSFPLREAGSWAQHAAPYVFYALVSLYGGSTRSRRAIPSRCQQLHVIETEGRIGAEDRQSLDLGLRDEQPVERVAVLLGQRRDVQGVAMEDWKRDDAGPSHQVRHDVLGSVRQPQLPQRVLDRDLPGARRRKQQLVVRGGDELPGRGGEPFRRREHPQPHLGVEEDSHSSNALRMSSGSGASKSSATKTRPFSVPSGRSVRTGVAGTRRATGTPALAMITSSPAATRCKSLERWVLASWTLYFMVK